jgi:hypothetical protein
MIYLIKEIRIRNRLKNANSPAVAGSPATSKLCRSACIVDIGNTNRFKNTIRNPIGIMYDTTVEAVPAPKISLHAIIDIAETNAPTPTARPVFDPSIASSASNGFAEFIRVTKMKIDSLVSYWVLKYRQVIIWNCHCEGVVEIRRSSSV